MSDNLEPQIEELLSADDIADVYASANEDAAEILADIETSSGAGPVMPKDLGDKDSRSVGNLMSAVEIWIEDVVDVVWIKARNEKRIAQAALKAVEAELRAEMPDGYPNKESRDGYVKRHFRWVQRQRELLVWQNVYDTIERQRASWEKKMRLLSRVGGFGVEEGRGSRRLDNLGKRRMSSPPKPAR